MIYIYIYITLRPLQLALEMWVYIYRVVVVVASVVVVVVSRTSKSSLYTLTVKCDQRSRGLNDVFGRLPKSTFPLSEAMTMAVAVVCIDAWRMCVREVWDISPWAEYALRCYRPWRAVWYRGGEKGGGCVCVCVWGEWVDDSWIDIRVAHTPLTAVTTATLPHTTTSDMPPLYRDRYWWRGGDVYIGVR